jgi:hypothetical protein
MMHDGVAGDAAYVAVEAVRGSDKVLISCPEHPMDSVRD